MPQYLDPDGGLGSFGFVKRVKDTAPKATTTDYSSFLIPSFLGLGTGLRTGAQVLAGFESVQVGKFNVSQIKNEIAQLGVNTELGLSQFARQAIKLEGKQKTAIATSGLAYSGSMVDLMAETQAQIELQRIDIQRQSDLQAQALRTKAQLESRKARSASTGSFITAGAEAASGIANILGRL